jgi:hypothetical protein
MIKRFAVMSMAQTQIKNSCQKIVPCFKAEILQEFENEELALQFIEDYYSEDKRRYLTTYEGIWITPIYYPDS